MADENKDKEAPQFDADALAANLRGEFRTALREFSAEQEQRETQRQEQAQAREREASFATRQASDPVAAAVLPIVAPALTKAQLDVLDAKDAAIFYSTNPKAAKDREAVEAAFDRLKAQGTPLKREEVWAWHKGKNLNKYAEEMVAEQQAAARAAEAAAGANGGNRQEVQAPKALTDPYGATTEELGAALKNVSF